MAVHRVQLDFKKEMMADFDRLVDAAGETSRVGMIRRAIRLYSLLFQRRTDGYKIFAEREVDGKTERNELIGW